MLQYVVYYTARHSCMTKRIPLQFSPTQVLREMVEFRSECEGLSMSAFICRLIEHDWHAVHGHLGPQAMRNLYANTPEITPRRRIKCAGGRYRRLPQ